MRFVDPISRAKIKQATIYRPDIIFFQNSGTDLIKNRLSVITQLEMRFPAKSAAFNWIRYERRDKKGF